MGVILDQQFANEVPLNAEPAAEGHLSWNVALDLWLVAELVWLIAVVVVLASTDLRGRLPGTSHLPIAAGWIVAFALLSWYHRSIEAQVVRTDRLKQAFYDWTKASIITIIGGFMLGELRVTSRVWVFATFVAGVVTITIIGAIARHVIAELSRKGSLGERIAIYGCTEKTEALISLIENGAGPVAKVLLMSDRRNRGGKTSYNGMVVGHDLEDFVTKIKARKIDTVIIDLPWSAGSRIDDVVQCLEQISVNISMAPATLDLEGAKQSVTYVGGRPTLSLYRRRMTGGQAIAKIAFDRTAAAIGLLILAVPLLIVALAVKTDSPGPALFRQKRRGMNNEAFDMLKFRSMYVASADANADKLVSRNDSRVTKVGAFLRKTSIDELPQLVNVLFGQMSLVGPRPHAYGAKADERLYEEVVKRYPARHRVLPGITGLAQVRGFRGNTEEEKDIVNRVESDIEYIDRWTPALDIQIIARTAAVFLFQAGAY
nr:exopolysaccharide biosynthesis polyprenyl glycosylphosphotransferase [Polymorphobacter sp.]